MPDGLKVGDVVRLKSGGPKMTINVAPDNSGIVRAVWFHNFDEDRGGFFAEAALEKVTDVPMATT